MLDLRELAYELDDLKSDPEGDGDRLAVLTDLELELGGDIHVAKNRGVTLYSEEESERLILDQCDDDHLPDWAVGNIDWDGVVDDLRRDWTVIEFDGETYYTQDLR